MAKFGHYFSIFFLGLSLTQCRSVDTKDPPDSDLNAQVNKFGCEIIIVGGGAAGLHTAFRLGPQYKDKVCLFEKENRLGGRIYDISKDPNARNGPYIAAGARRIMEGQKVLFDLAAELGLELQKPDEDAELIFARGMYSSNKDDFVKLYPGLQVDMSKGDAETQLLQKLMKGDERKRVDQYPDYKTYVKKVVGEIGYQYLRDMTRFRGDFEYPLSAKAYLEFLDEDFDVCCRASFPVGGMSAFIRGLERKAREYGVHIFKGEAVKSIARSGTGFRVTTAANEFISKKLVIAVPPLALEQIGGDVSEAIRAQEQFKALIGVKVTTIAQWYETPWWKGAKRLSDDKEVWRAWTTDSCINSIEIPQEDYAASQFVIRAVYNDQAECVKKWEDLAKQGNEAVEKEIQKGLEKLLGNNGVTKPVKVGRPLKTAYWLWPDAWYYIKAGSPFSNHDIYDWAVEPLKGEAVGLVSEGYNTQRSAWSDGAYKSSIHLLNTKYGMTLPGLK